MIEQDRKNPSLAGEKGERASSAAPPFTKRYYRIDEVAHYFSVSVQLEAKRRILERKVIPLGEIRGKDSAK